ncbi:MAG TPA: lipopolysaccharide transport periplasmic protein LptA [Gammaproteobacteria bacterium]
MFPERILAIVVLLILQPCVYALPADTQQPIEIAAGKMTLDQTNSISTYSGRVVLSQGSIRIEAEKLTVYMRNKKLERLEAFGSETQQALFRQKLHNGEETQAQAGHIEYYTRDSRMVLTQQARLQQGGNHIQSERIDYNTASNSLMAGQSGQQDPTAQQKRVRIVIEPENREATGQTQP